MPGGSTTPVALATSAATAAANFQTSSTVSDANSRTTSSGRRVVPSAAMATSSPSPASWAASGVSSASPPGETRIPLPNHDGDKEDEDDDEEEDGNEHQTSACTMSSHTRVGAALATSDSTTACSVKMAAPDNGSRSSSAGTQCFSKTGNRSKIAGSNASICSTLSSAPDASPCCKSHSCSSPDWTDLISVLKTATSAVQLADLVFSQPSGVHEKWPCLSNPNRDTIMFSVVVTRRHW